MCDYVQVVEESRKKLRSGEVNLHAYHSVYYENGTECDLTNTHRKAQVKVRDMKGEEKGKWVWVGGWARGVVTNAGMNGNEVRSMGHFCGHGQTVNTAVEN